MLFVKQSGYVKYIVLYSETARITQDKHNSTNFNRLQVNQEFSLYLWDDCDDWSGGLRPPRPWSGMDSP